jgi:predicted RNA-binding protein with PIN domain
MINYIIDGNNVIGKNPFLMKLQKKDKQSAREKLVLKLDRYFLNKKSKATLHFDGYANENIHLSKIKIIYSENKTADEKIKFQIEHSNSTRNTIVVTSDNNLAKYAKVCSCKVIPSEEFIKLIENSERNTEEEDRIKQISNQEILKIFGAK